MSAAFKSAAKGAFRAECVNETGRKSAKGNLGSLKLPVIFAISEKGNCYLAYENVPFDASVQDILRIVRRADEFRRKAEKEGFATADACGEFLQRMEKLVGGPRRVIAKGYYRNVFNKLRELDPKDESGWIRRYTFGDNGSKHPRGDGMEIVTQATKFRERKNFAGGEAFLKKQMKELPTKRLTTEQRQSLAMAKFSLYRDDRSKREELIELLRSTAATDETTFWGAAALGWLKIWNRHPISLYWGWKAGDLKGNRLDTTIAYGVSYKLGRAGRYVFSVIPQKGPAPQVREIVLFGKDETTPLLTVKNPESVNGETRFSFALTREQARAVEKLVLKGTADADGASSGRFRIVRQAFPPRPRRSTAVAFTPSVKSVVGKYLLRVIDRQDIDDIAAKEGGLEFLKTFFANEAWMEQFAGSGPAGGERASGTGPLGKALKALDFLVWADRRNFILGTKQGRNLATALALNHGATWNETKLLEFFSCYRAWAEDGTLYEPSKDYDVYQWRQAVSFARMDHPVENLRWLHHFANTDMEAYFRLIWQVPYRKTNCFGDSIYKPRFFEPWHHRFPHQELVHRVGGVCGQLSMFASNAAAARGIRSFPVGQPGHCAYAIRTEDPDRWGIGNNVTHHTKPRHWGCRNFTDLEEQTRFYESKNRMASERARWAGDYAAALKLGPNWHAAEEWRVKLVETKPPPEAWLPYGEAVRESFASAAALSNGWKLYIPFIHSQTGRAARLEAARKGFLAFKENRARTIEAPYFNEIALDPVAKIFRNDKNHEAIWELLPAILDGQTNTRTCYKQAIDWLSRTLMKDDESTQRFLAIVIAHAEKTNTKLDYPALIQKTSEEEDLTGFAQIYALMDRLSPNSRAKRTKKTWPTEMAGGELLSMKGLLKTSSCGERNDPIFYRHALDEVGFAGGSAFRTASEDAPWAVVVLPGPAEVSAITVVNAGTGGDEKNQVPLCVWVSENGQDWEEVYATDDVKSEWQIRLGSSVKAQYVKVGRKPGSKKVPFHLHKILVYGDKLY